MNTEFALKLNKFIHEQCIDYVPHDIGWNVVKLMDEAVAQYKEEVERLKADVETYKTIVNNYADTLTAVGKLVNLKEGESIIDRVKEMELKNNLMADYVSLAANSYKMTNDKFNEEQAFRMLQSRASELKNRLINPNKP